MIYSVIVKPGSKKGPLIVEAPVINNSRAAKELTVYLREKPIDGAANIALIKVLAKHFHVAKTCIVIKSGAASRHKLIEIL